MTSLLCGASNSPRGSFRLLDAFLAPLPLCLPDLPNERLGRISLHCGTPDHPCAVESWSSSARNWARARHPHSEENQTRPHAVVMAGGKCFSKFWTHSAHDIGARRGTMQLGNCRPTEFSATRHCAPLLLLQLGLHEFNLTHKSTQDHQTLFTSRQTGVSSPHNNKEDTTARAAAQANITPRRMCQTCSARFLTRGRSPRARHFLNKED